MLSFGKQFANVSRALGNRNHLPDLEILCIELQTGEVRRNDDERCISNGVHFIIIREKNRKQPTHIRREWLSYDASVR